jgi:TetR/AcrR family transcriptional repressor of lmrAB and yxaGH operons
MARMIAEKSDITPMLAELFRRHGYEGASIGIIVSATGLGRSSLYHLFPGGKQEMATAVLDHIARWFGENVFAPLRGMAPDAALDHMFSAVSDYFRGGQRICLVGAFALDATRDSFAQEIQTYFNDWLTALEQCLRRAGHGDAQARTEAQRILAGIQGGIVLARATGEEQRFHDVIANLRAAQAQIAK